MLSKVSIDQLRVGMYIHAFAGSWLDHPFWRTQFTIESEAELRRMIDGGVKEVWVDVSHPGATAPVDSLSAGSAQPPLSSSAPESVAGTPARPARPGKRSAPTANALAEAESLFRRSVPKVEALFAQVRLGKVADTSGCGPLVDEIADAVLAHPGVLLGVMRLKHRDMYTYMHSVAVCALMLALGRAMGLGQEPLRAAGMAGLLHDLGKAAMPVDVLSKAGPLTAAEFTIMRRHPEEGHRLLQDSGEWSAEVLDVCLHHHEKVDGTGYPHGLQGDQISLVARMGAVCDVYDAVTSARPYKAAWDPGEAIRTMARWSGHFDPRVFKAFVSVVGIYPVGSLVRLASGKLAVVTTMNPSAPTAPVVTAFYSTRSNLPLAPQLIDLANPSCKDKLVGAESPAKWNFPQLDRLCGSSWPEH